MTWAQMRGCRVLKADLSTDKTDYEKHFKTVTCLNALVMI